jgi:hypothetical protein
MSSNPKPLSLGAFYKQAGKNCHTVSRTGSFGKHQYFGTSAKYLPIVVIVFPQRRGIQQVPKKGEASKE